MADATKPASELSVRRREMKKTMEAMEGGVLATLPPGYDQKFLTRVFHMAVAVWDDSDGIRKCDPISFVRAVTRCAQVGLEPNSPTAQAYLVPRKGKVCLEIHGRGWARMAIEQKVLKRLDWNIVHKNDVFEHSYGTSADSFVKHKPYMDGPPGEVFAVYAIGTYIDETQDHFALSRWELDRMKELADSLQQSGDAVAWRDNFDGMAGAKACKFFFKRRCQGLDPLLQKAIHADDHADIGEELSADPELKEVDIKVKSGGGATAKPATSLRDLAGVGATNSESATRAEGG